MSRLFLLAALCFYPQLSSAATFGSVTTVVGSVSDIVLDEGRRRLYLINANSNRLEVYSLPPNPIRQTATVALDAYPLSAAMSPDGRFLYVTAHNASSLNIVDLDTLRVVNRASIPARPEGVAVGFDGRVLVTTIGTGVGNSQNTLLVYDPERAAFDSVVFVPFIPQVPVTSPPAGRQFLASRSQLVATPDGQYIVGVNIPNNNQRAIFVYEVASSTVLRSRLINNVSSVLAISPDGKKLMSGLTLIDLETLEVIAQQNLANAPYPIQPNTNFNTQQNQGGSVFSPDGGTLYSAFNISPVQNPPARPNVGQLMLSDPENLLIQTALQMPENLAGKMVVTSDGGTLYAISESGFAAIPIGTMRNQPIATLSTGVVQLANDQCGVTAERRTQSVTVTNQGSGRLTATAQVLQLNPVGPGGLGGVGGPGGGIPGGGVIIVLPPAGGGAVVPGPVIPGQPGGGAANAAIFQTAPQVRTQNTPDGPVVSLTFNQINTRTLGTVSPIHDFLIQSNEAINIPPRLRAFQNNRNADARGDVIPMEVGISANEALVDMEYDTTRNRVYIANSGLNRIDVYDARGQAFLNPIKVGQLPRSIAIAPGGQLMYVANSGGESIQIVDLNEGVVVGKLRFPPLPFNATAALITPQNLVATQRGPLVIMNNGALWSAVGNEMVPRRVSPAINLATLPAPRTMAATPNGEYAIILAGNGFVYLYDAAQDEFVNARQIFTNPIQGYFGPVSAGPGGRYFLVNGTVLNPALTPIGSAGSVVGGNANQTFVRPISGVAALNNNSFVRYAPAVALQANNPIVTTTPSVEMADVNTGNALRQIPAIEGPISTVTGNARANVQGRSIVVDPAGTTAYVLTVSGLSVIPLAAITPAERPVVTTAGIGNVANGRASLAPGTLVNIPGNNLGQSARIENGDLPTLLGGVCVTLNNRPMPLMATSPTQITAQIPPELVAGRYPLVVRNLERKTSTVAPINVTLAKYAPAVIVDAVTKQAAIYHEDGSPVTKDKPTTRDRRLVMYAVGLGPTKGGPFVSGKPAAKEPPAVTDPVSVFFGDKRYRQAGVVVEWSGLAAGLIGIYELHLYVPGDRMRGDDLDVTVRVGGVDSPTGGEFDPKVAVE
ncbi:MAG: hypothetical protein JNK48_19700 [Bryobacterales bacterium]|nr:hypothetical protein [Bryobacterales bacterium]